MDYYLYHDESKVSGYWQGMLLLPIHTKETVLRLLIDARNDTGYQIPISLKQIRKLSGQKARLVNRWIQIGIFMLVSNLKDKSYLINTSSGPQNFFDPVGAKFIVFRERDNLITMGDLYPDDASKIETLFRMGLKGGMHLFGNKDNPIHISQMHFDGYKHYLRNIDKTRVIDRMLDGLRSYCSISNSIDVIDDRTSDHRLAESQDYDDCQLIQLTDLLLGCFRVALGYSNNEVHKTISLPVKKLVRKQIQGPRRMKNSRWNNSFYISHCYLEEGRWEFKPIMIVKPDLQIPLGL